MKKVVWGEVCIYLSIHQSFYVVQLDLPHVHVVRIAVCYVTLHIMIAVPQYHSYTTPFPYKPALPQHYIPHHSTVTPPTPTSPHDNCNNDHPFTLLYFTLSHRPYYIVVLVFTATPHLTPAALHHTLAPVSQCQHVDRFNLPQEG